MFGWVILGLLIVVGIVVGAYVSARWGRGAQSAMSPEMESEVASYINYGRGPHIGG
jgi:hypothetical protein